MPKIGSNEYSLLHIFTSDGKTFTFKNVTVLVDNESVLLFEYYSVSDGAKKRGNFYKSRIVGHTLQES